MPAALEPKAPTASARDPIDAAAPLIAPDEGAPVELIDAEGGDVVLICEHAGNLVPRSLDSLGAAPDVLTSHVAWDPGAAAVTRMMAEALGAPAILQRFSRLVYDCNRPPEAESAMPARSEVYDIPGNAGLTAVQRAARVEAIYRPFRDAVAGLLEDRLRAGRAPAVVTIHSFTPVFHGRRRSVELGLLHDSDARLADAMLDAAAGWSDLAVRRNQPYGPEDGVTHTLEVDAIARGLANVMIEIRNDLIDTPARQAAMASRLAALVEDGLRRLPRAGTPEHPAAAS